MLKLWISYSGKRYRLIGTYKGIEEAKEEFFRYSLYHTTKGDRLKLTWKHE